MAYAAIVAWDDSNRVTKYQDFATFTEAQDHVVSVVADYPSAFAAEAPEVDVSDWLVDPDNDTVSNYVALADRKTEMKAQATARFTVKRDAGTTISISSTNYPISTTHDAAVEIREGLNKILSTDPAGTIDIVTRAGANITMTAAVAKAMIAAVHAHVAACQETESALHAAIDAAADGTALDLINIEAGTVSGTGGWPSLTLDASAHAASESVEEERRLANIAALAEIADDLPESTAAERALKTLLGGLVSAM